jgi:hypothetical protein
VPQSARTAQTVDLCLLGFAPFAVAGNGAAEIRMIDWDIAP